MGEYSMSDVVEYNMELDQIVERDFTEEELVIRQNIVNSVNEIQSAYEQENATNLNIKNSALDKLKTLGLTEDEAKAIVGL
jgi:sugar-specific transcriptional regulator TrmB